MGWLPPPTNAKRTPQELTEIRVKSIKTITEIFMHF